MCNTKICIRCQEEKLLSEFKNRSGKLSHLKMSYCTPCYNRRQYERRMKNRSDKEKDRVKKNVDKRKTKGSEQLRLRKSHLMRKYNMTINDYDYKFHQQNGRCAICDKEDKLYVDHNHKTGEVRELLCHQCNTGIGYLKEDTYIMQEAINYILRHNTISS